MAIILTQKFDYMVDQGLSYNYVNGSKTFHILFHLP